MLCTLFVDSKQACSHTHTLNRSPSQPMIAQSPPCSSLSWPSPSLACALLVLWHVCCCWRDCIEGSSTRSRPRHAMLLAARATNAADASTANQQANAQHTAGGAPPLGQQRWPIPANSSRSFRHLLAGLCVGDQCALSLSCLTPRGLALPCQAHSTSKHALTCRLVRSRGSSGSGATRSCSRKAACLFELVCVSSTFACWWCCGSQTHSGLHDTRERETVEHSLMMTTTSVSAAVRRLLRRTDARDSRAVFVHQALLPPLKRALVRHTAYLSVWCLVSGVWCLGPVTGGVTWC